MIKKMSEISTGMKLLNIISSLIVIVVGIFLIFVPRYIVWLASAAVFVHGVHLIIRYIKMKDARNGWDIITGIISVLLGAFLLFSGPEAKILGVLMIEMIIAVWVLIAGIVKIIESFKFKKDGVGKSVWGILGGIVMVFFGILLIAKPALGAVGIVFVFAIFAGVSLIIVGFTGLAETLSGKKIFKISKKTPEETPQEENPKET